VGNPEQIERVKQGSDTWNTWRKQHSEENADLSGANLSSANLSNANLSSANLSGTNLSNANLSGAYLSNASLYGANLDGVNLSSANLSGAYLNYAGLSSANLGGVNLSGAHLIRVYLVEANLSGVQLSGANLSGANLSGANLSGANLSRANLNYAHLNYADLSRANLREADLNGAILVETDLRGATLTRCSIYGISAWNVKLGETIQDSLIITRNNEPTITVDNLKIAQFLYLLINNAEIRDVIDTIARKAVLILGRFTPERKPILNALREELREQNYLPILFDFEKPASRDLTETVNTLAHLSRFIIADLTDPSSIPQELATIIPFSIVPVQPLLIQDDSRREYAMFQDLRRRYHWVLPTFRYENTECLLASLKEHIIKPAELKAQELEK